MPDKPGKVALKERVAIDIRTEAVLFVVGDHDIEIFGGNIIIQKTSQIKKPVGQDLIFKVKPTHFGKYLAAVKDALLTQIVPDKGDRLELFTIIDLLNCKKTLPVNKTH